MKSGSKILRDSNWSHRLATLWSPRRRMSSDTSGLSTTASAGYSSAPPAPIQGFDVLYEPGCRRFTMVSDAPVGVAKDSVIITCSVSNRKLPPLHDGRGSCTTLPVRQSSSSRRVAYPTYSPDALPIYFTAFIGSVERSMTMEVLLCSQAGALCVDGVVLHPGPPRVSVVEMPVEQASAKYRGPLLNDRHLAEQVVCSVRQSINPLVEYRQHVRCFFDPFVNPAVRAECRFDHYPVHSCPSHLTESIHSVLKEVGVDDQLAAFVHEYALFVQAEERRLWEERVRKAMGLLRPGDVHPSRLISR